MFLRRACAFALIFISGTQVEAQQKPTLKGQITSVNQLSDIAPNDWAYSALQSLVERYGCIVGYPNRTYRGNHTLSRWEFAAGLNACINTIERLIQENSILNNDLDKLIRLAKEFKTELAVLGTKVDHLEQQVAFLEDHQFTTTTQLRGEVIFAVSGAFGNQQAVSSGRSQSDRNVEDNITFTDRVRLSLNTSFRGEDLLRLRLQARNTIPFGTAVTGSNMTRLGFDGNDNNRLEINQAFYRFPLGDLVTIQLDAVNVGLTARGVPTYSPVDSGARDAISRYGYSPIYRQGGGPGIDIAINPRGIIGANFSYLTSTGDNPDSGQGLTNGDFSALAQLNLQPNSVLQFGLTYAHSYETPERGNVSFLQNTGSVLTSRPFGNIATTGNHYGTQATIRFNPHISLFGWGGYSSAIAEDSPNSVANLRGSQGSKADIFYYAVGLAFFDLFQEGSLAGLIFGQPPKLINNEVREIVNSRVRKREDDDTSYHLEAFYRFPVTNNIEVTPGFLVIFNPEHNKNNATLYVGTIRTTFRF